MRFSFPIVFFITLVLATGVRAQTQLHYTILKESDHNLNAFTQGLYWQDGKLYESSGLYQRSFIEVVDADDNRSLARKKIPPELFAEGITLVDDSLYVLTWKAGLALKYSADTLTLEKTIAYAGEGWGLTYDGEHLIMSDGSEFISFRDPKDFTVIKKITVKSKWRKWDKINELEYVQGHIWANVWGKDLILKISPQTGEVVSIVNLRELTALNNHKPGHSVLNGIAYDSEKEAFWITGKLWPKRYLVRFTEATP